MRSTIGPMVATALLLIGCGGEVEQSRDGSGGAGGSAGVESGGSGGAAGSGGSGGTVKAACGNGIRELDEACDRDDLGGKTCADFGRNTGTLGCATDCTFDATDCVSVEFCGNGIDDDGDQLADCADDDCSGDIVACPRCGDGVINQPGEACDGADSPETCTDLGFDAGETSCAPDCTTSVAGCSHFEDCSTAGDEDLDGAADCDDTDCVGAFDCPRCGDGILQRGETCEGSVPAGIDCSTFGHNTGEVRCNADTCTVDSTACSTIELCGTPGDEDGDGAADCADTECIGLPVCSVCGNGVKEAGETCDDGNTISNDGCSSSCAIEGRDCSLPIVLGPQHRNADGDWVFTGDTTPWTFTFMAQCTNTTSERDGVLQFTAPQTGEYFIDYQTSFNGVLMVYSGVCGTGSQVGCSDEPQNLTLQLSANQTIFIVVDGYGPFSGSINDDYGPFTLVIQQASVCGDGVVQGSEVCDFGDTANGDGCSNSCRVEPGWVCTAAACTHAVCGNGVVEAQEQCDDNNAIDDDTCRNDCTVARCGNGHIDMGAFGTPVVVSAPVVTNPFGDTGHVCDDGGTCIGPCTVDVSGYGGATEHGICQALGYPRAISAEWGKGPGASDPLTLHAYNWACNDYGCGQGGSYTGSNCDDMAMLGSITCASAPAMEACDDGNTVSGDGCSSGCQLEP